MSNSAHSAVVYDYRPADWDQGRFLALGGFSVVFMNYDKAPTVERAVRAALAQDFPLLEFVFMDDASGDGSGDVMERLARAYRGRHRVVVVRNSRNLYITGQWDAAARIATGRWLGMFCADDVARPDRVSRVAERIRAFPSLLGVCTSGAMVDAATGAPRGRLGGARPPQAVDGAASLAECLRGFGTVGATAFWSRTLFDEPLPERVPLDDCFLHWKLYLSTRGAPGVVWLYDPAIDAVEYSVGAGVTTAVPAGSRPGPRADILRARRFNRLAAATMREVRAFARRRGLGGAAAERLFTLLVRHHDFLAGGTWRRLASAPALICASLRAPLAPGERLRMARERARAFVRDFFGVAAGAAVLRLLAAWRRRFPLSFSPCPGGGSVIESAEEKGGGR